MFRNMKTRSHTTTPHTAARRSPLPFILSAMCLVPLWFALASYAADPLGPVFPRNATAIDTVTIDTHLPEPQPLPKRHPLLQRPQGRQVVFDDIDPVGSIMPPGFLYDEDFALPLSQPGSSSRTPASLAPSVNPDNASIFTEHGEIIYGEIISSHAIDFTPSFNFDSENYVTGAMPISFGMGLFDNITFFSDVTTFKTGLNNGVGSFGFSEGMNWSTALTPQGSVTAQYGVRAVQGDFSHINKRNQFFMTLGLFKRFDFARVQGGIAIDWLTDRSQFGPVELRQMRCELSRRFLDGSIELGFHGGFDVFQDQPKIPFRRGTRAVDVHDYYTLFARKYLSNGGQIEFRCGATAEGDLVVNALGEVAISDRLAVNGGLSVLAPGKDRYSPYGDTFRESWTMSMGIVLYFRGGAVFRQINPHRAMFEVANNNSFFTRIVR